MHGKWRELRSADSTALLQHRAHGCITTHAAVSAQQFSDFNDTVQCGGLHVAHTIMWNSQRLLCSSTRPATVRNYALYYVDLLMHVCSSGICSCTAEQGRTAQWAHDGLRSRSCAGRLRITRVGRFPRRALARYGGTIESGTTAVRSSRVGSGERAFRELFVDNRKDDLADAELQLELEERRGWRRW